MVPYCLVPGPWVIRVGNNGLEYDGLIKEVVGVDPGSVGLCLKVHLWASYLLSQGSG